MPKSITETFRDETVLITGFTGFLGKILVEKLLRSCPIRKVAVIVRNKKGITAEQRVQDIYKQPLFDRLRKEKPDFMNQIKVFDGCLDDPLMGLLSIDRDWIIKNVNLIFHCAATIRFNEALEVATKINVHGTEQLLLLSKNIKNLKGIVHVSTAYSHSPRKEICEEYYPVPIVANNDLNNLLSTNKSLTEILGVWPNTYTFTKAIAENLLVISNENDLPISIFRPSIIGCAKSEPQPGWVEGMNGPTAIISPYILGLLRITTLSENKIADIIPADYTVNALICVMWDTVNRYQNTNQFNMKPKIFNYVSGVESPITWNAFSTEVRVNYFEMPPLSAVWYMFAINTTNVWAIKMLRFFLHWVPALVMDLYLMVIGKKPKMLKIYEKINIMSDLLYEFTSKEWKFDNRNTRELWSLLSHEDRMSFWFSFEDFDWKSYMRSYVFGVRSYILGEDQSNIEEALAKHRKLFWIHNLCVALIVCFVFQVYWIF